MIFRDEFLKKKDGTLYTKMLDMEGDELEIYFNNDDGVKIETDEYSHIYLSYNNLEKLCIMIQEAEEYYEEEYKKDKNYLDN